jgi:hypothetical protein
MDTKLKEPLQTGIEAASPEKIMRGEIKKEEQDD